MDALQKTDGVSHNDESLRKDRNRGESPEKCSEHGPSSTKRAQKEQKIEFWIREEKNYCASENEQKSKNRQKRREEMFRNPRTTHAREQDVEAGRTKRCRERVSGRRVQPTG